jgi:CheY-like chemotaxis protein
MEVTLRAGRGAEVRKHILLVDDEPGFRFSAGIALRKVGYTVTEAPDGKEAYRLLRQALADGEPFDLVVTDIRMPGMSGIELLEELKAYRISVPLLAVTGFSDKELIRELQARGCPEFLEKPFRPDELVARIAKLL